MSRAPAARYGPYAIVPLIERRQTITPIEARPARDTPQNIDVRAQDRRPIDLPRLAARLETFEASELDRTPARQPAPGRADDRPEQRDQVVGVLIHGCRVSLIASSGAGFPVHSWNAVAPCESSTP